MVPSRAGRALRGGVRDERVADRPAPRQHREARAGRGRPDRREEGRARAFEFGGFSTMSTHPDAEDDLDFTQPAKPGPPPPPERLASARKEAVKVTPQLAKTGFYVAMARHAGGRAMPRNGSRHSILLIEDDKDLSHLLGEAPAQRGLL